MAIYSEEQINRLSLIITPNIGPVTYFKLLNHFSSAAESISYLKVRFKNANICSSQIAQNEINKAINFGAKIIFHDQDEYPILLKEINDLPPVIWTLGNTKILKNNKILSIVGSRNASNIGKCLARKFAYILNQAGYIICSGMALGIDTTAHINSLQNGTIAILANGVDIIYPLENYALYHDIIKNGVIISEYPMNFKSQTWSFIRRNRIISGISLGTIVIESVLNSGSLATANNASSQGREVFTLPASPMDLRFKGNNWLIKNGAILVESPEEILEHLESSKYYLNSCTNSHFTMQEIFDFNDKNSSKYIDQILNYISCKKPTNIHSIAQFLKLPIQIINTIILELELSGLVASIDQNNILKL